MSFSVTISGGEVVRAGRHPFVGRPEYRIFSPIGQAHDFLRDPIFHSGRLRCFLPDHGWRPGKNLDPSSQALDAAGAVPAEQYDFRMLGPNYLRERPLVGRASEMWTIRERLIQIPQQHDWRFGPRSGKDANGSRAHGVMSLDSTPAAARKAPARRLLGFLKAKGQVGNL